MARNRLLGSRPGDSPTLTPTSLEPQMRSFQAFRCRAETQPLPSPRARKVNKAVAGKPPGRALSVSFYMVRWSEQQ